VIKILELCYLSRTVILRNTKIHVTRCTEPSNEDRDKLEKILKIDIENGVMENLDSYFSNFECQCINMLMNMPERK
jgi:hypothetical protein